MAGHSQFKNIMHRKGGQDAKRARAFAKIGREITVAVKLGASDPAHNPRLRSAMIAARQANMTKDVIDRAIKKGQGVGGGEDFSEVRYEGRGPGGVSIIVEALTDNRNRTSSDLRSMFAKNGGAFGETVAFQFDRVGVVRFALGVADADTMLEAAIDAGADDVTTDAGHEVVTAADALGAVQAALETRFGEAESAKLEWRPNMTVALDEDTARAVLKLIDLLDEHDDVQTVTANFEVDEAVLEKLSA